MRLLIVVPSQDRATGNWVTATRLQQGLTARGHTVTVGETDGDPEKLRAVTVAAAPQLVLLLHAWRSGRPWLETGLLLPSVVLLTGTDVNAGLHDPTQTPVIETVLHRAAAILSQNHLTVADLRRDRPQMADKIHYLPPGITLGSDPFPLRQRLSISLEEFLCLCPAGIRPVKGGLELIAMCEPLLREGRSLRLAFCGPVLDEDYGARFLGAVTACSWATYLGTIPPAAMPAALRQADVIVSNAFSEGLPNVLVEALVLGRPVVARDIPGNAAVVVDGVNGLLYRDEAGFCSAIRRLQDEPSLRSALAHPDPERFAPGREIDALETICRNLLGTPAAMAGNVLP